MTDDAATEPPSAHSQPDGRDRSKDSRWYEPELPELQPDARELLEKHSGLAPTAVEPHIYAIVSPRPSSQLVLMIIIPPHEQRDKAWQIFPYPCIGGFRFLSLTLAASREYAALLTTLRRPGACFLDLGCCFGTEIRKLVFDGVPPENCVGTDLRPEFFDIGYELFRDRERMRGARFFAADIFDESCAEFQALEGKVDVVCAGSFFHLFDLPGQTKAAERVAKLLRRNAGDGGGAASAAVVVGRQVGSVSPGLKAREGVTEKGMYRHDARTWREMWDGVGRKLGVEFEVECRMEEAPRFNHGKGDADMRMLYFTVKMLG
nr:methyltransferase trt5 [Quercus suber]